MQCEQLQIGQQVLAAYEVVLSDARPNASRATLVDATAVMSLPEQTVWTVSPRKMGIQKESNLNQVCLQSEYNQRFPNFRKIINQ